MLLIFDFDGTLADTRPILMGVFNRLSGVYHFQPIAESDLEKWRSIPAGEVFRGLHINPLLLYFVFRKARRELFHEMSHVEFASPQLPEVLRQLSRIPYLKLGILTSNARANVERFLSLQNIHEFAFVKTSATLWSKARSLRKIRKQYAQPGELLIYIGDEIRDIEAARDANVCIGVVGWGNNTCEALQARQPDYFFMNPQEILQLAALASSE